jgi:hypothetical protein
MDTTTEPAVTYPELYVEPGGTLIFDHDIDQPQEGPMWTQGSRDALNGLAWSGRETEAMQAAMRQLMLYRGAQAMLDEEYRGQMRSAYHETARQLGYTTRVTEDGDGLLLSLAEVLTVEQYTELRDRAHERVAVTHTGSDDALGRTASWE